MEKIKKIIRNYYTLFDLSCLYSLEHFIKFKNKWCSMEEIKDGLGYWVKNTNQNIKSMKELFKLAEANNISDDELRLLCLSNVIERKKQHNTYRAKPKTENRDNKDVLVGSGGSNCNKVRYPSKKRSLSTWKNFYKLFPSLAERDGFDGKTSSRMK